MGNVCLAVAVGVMALLTVSTAVMKRIVVRLLYTYKDLWGEGGGGGGGKNVGTVVHRVLSDVCNADCVVFLCGGHLQ